MTSAISTRYSPLSIDFDTAIRNGTVEAVERIAQSTFYKNLSKEDVVISLGTSLVLNHPEIFDILMKNTGAGKLEKAPQPEVQIVFDLLIGEYLEGKASFECVQKFIASPLFDALSNEALNWGFLRAAKQTKILISDKNGLRSEPKPNGLRTNVAIIQILLSSRRSKNIPFQSLQKALKNLGSEQEEIRLAIANSERYRGFLTILSIIIRKAH